MYCKKCGNPTEGNSVFCNRCRVLLEPENNIAPIEEQSNDAEGQTESLFNTSGPGNAGRDAPSQTFKQPLVLNNGTQSELKLKYKKKKSKLLSIIAIVAVLVIAAVSAALFGQSVLKTKKYDELIDTGNKYFEEIKYEEAVVTFLEAVDLKPKREEAYTRVAKGYIGLDEPEKAKDILEKGLANVKEHGEEFKALCDELGVAYKGQENEEPSATEESALSSATQENATASETVTVELTSKTPQTQPKDTTKKSEPNTQKIVEPEHTNGDEYHATVSAQGGLSLRSGPGQNYDRLLIIPNGATVVEVGYNADYEWVYVKYNSQNGWVKKEYVSFEGGAMAKPVIYLYPQRETKVRVDLNIIDGELTCTYPKYNHGWDVTAFPGGHITNNSDGKEYSYLYWEATADIEYDFSKGFVVKGSDTASFLQDKLAEIGLTPKEYNEFIVYWLPLMQDNEYNLISFQDAIYTNTAQLKITPQPDSILRIFMAYKPLNEKIEVEEQIFTQFNRTGFTVVEWGGTGIK